MKNILYLLLLCSNYLNAQIDTLFSDEREYGVFCFEEIKARSESSYKNDSSQFFIRIIEPQFVKKTIQISFEDADSMDIENGYLEVVIKPKHCHYFRYEYYEACLNSKNGMCTKKVTESDFIKKIMLDSLIEKDIQVEVFSLVSDGRVEKEILQKTPSRIQENEIYFSRKIWSGIREMACCLRRRPVSSTKQIEEALFERGYAVIFNGKIDTIEKSALTHFQKENGLPVGSLNLETLRVLKLQF